LIRLAVRGVHPEYSGRRFVKENKVSVIKRQDAAGGRRKKEKEKENLPDAGGDDTDYTDLH